ncbi:hypothetical protein BAUCODRAFT_23630 [Baudoinia panamericana UAMH 10762]|uniref:Uncharacterized protein n=1 Tax=Baudoinia panamericana (strain UAMH 10762) TaxID=717646 RepID=M2NEC6_BAUPA|nr:uncharacterized protein BAUCODRAFT_23630 [Baudoinia panamericana UAMH 10762]EMC97310.1 hypothetical protein BAUCODRAFT_23630 [Baudoinia panamericana UAMH 10762]
MVEEQGFGAYKYAGFLSAFPSIHPRSSSGLVVAIVCFCYSGARWQSTFVFVACSVHLASGRLALVYCICNCLLWIEARAPVQDKSEGAFSPTVDLNDNVTLISVSVTLPPIKHVLDSIERPESFLTGSRGHTELVPPSVANLRYEYYPDMLAANSPMSYSSEASRSSDSPAYTPATSHRGSEAPFLARMRRGSSSSTVSTRRGTGRQPAGSRKSRKVVTAQRSTLRSASGAGAKLPKNVKERNARRNFTDIGRKVEDVLDLLLGCNWGAPYTQFSGNATSSGLRWDKMAIYAIVTSQFVDGIMQGYDAALRQDVVGNGFTDHFPARDRFCEQMRYKLTAALTKTREDHQVLKGSLLDDEDGEGACDHADKEKACCVHPGREDSDDWMTCRKTHRRKVMQTNFQARVNELARERARL